jgi:dTMP kinase
MNFVAIEGLDGAGKSTQIQMLVEHLRSRGRTVERLHFPRTEAGMCGSLIAQYLRGEMGDIYKDNPLVMAFLFAADRRYAAPTIEKWLADDTFVIVDRYVYSNLAYQCARLLSIDERNALQEQILRHEYVENCIPKPQKTLFLDVPPLFTQSILTKQRANVDRTYLCGKQDMHESDMQFQQEVRSIYLQQSNVDKDFKIIKCYEEQSANQMLSAEEIFRRISAHIDL